MEKQLKHISKLMSLVLRHQPEAIGLQLDENGWANVEELIQKINANGTRVDIATILIVVETNDKKRFGFNEDKTMIRANQGHSIEVDLNLKPSIPPDILYHGTADRFVDSILKEGLTKQQRQHVHLSRQIETARAVGTRHGKPVILHINAKAMQDDGYLFYESENNVWLVDTVPTKYITI
jgi:putative RNA 2'-phosphotransferase